MKLRYLLPAFAAVALGIGQRAEACSRILYVGDDSLRIVGRSLDWKNPIPTNIYVYPRGMVKQSHSMSGAISWTSKYGAVYAVGYDGGVTEGIELCCQVQHSEVVELDGAINLSGRVFQWESFLFLCQFNFGNSTFQADRYTGHLVGISRLLYFHVQIGRTAVCHYESTCRYAWNLSFVVCNAVDSIQESILRADISGDGLSVGNGEDIVGTRIHGNLVGSVLYLF